MQKHFFDIGGNTGQTFDYLDTLDRSYKDHKFWIFEPSPRHYSKLLEKCNSKANEYDIHICPFGIGGQTGIRHFREKDDPMGDSFQPWLASDHEVFDVNNGYTVHASVVSLPEFIINNTNPEDKIVLDIDTEGSEYEMLEALMEIPAAYNRITEIMVEWHHVKPENMVTSPEAFDAFCKQNNICVVHRGDSKLLVNL